MDFTKAIQDLKAANRTVRRRQRYACGLEEGSENVQEQRARFFFNSPDGQNGELYYELRKLGWRTSGYEAEYYWGVSKDGVRIEYVEGDVYITALADNKQKV